MNERLLQFIWQFQHFNKQELTLVNGSSFRIIHPGTLNTNQGPDFLEARIRIGRTLWVGSVEVHIKASDWYRHAHQFDKNYDNVILHVVWENDISVQENNIPVFTLQQRIPKLLLQQYENWMKRQTFIPCSNQAKGASDIIWLSWKERLLVERLQRKSAHILSYLQQNNGHWEETCWWLLARNFGISVNADAFEAVARSLPVTILAKHKEQLMQTEALLLGQAGLLNDDFAGIYPRKLQKEFRFYKKKYKLKPVSQPVHFLRMRPSAFPTIRLAQLARLLHQSAHLFSFFKETEELAAIRELLTVTASEFWHTHYTFREESSSRPKRLGRQMVNTIIINTVIPLVFSYGHLYKENRYMDKALQWLEETEAETNAITKGFMQLGINNENAFDSQALIELKNSYCTCRKCLDCAVGNALLKRSVVNCEW